MARFQNAKKDKVPTGLSGIDIMLQRPTSRPSGKASDIMSVLLGRLAHVSCVVEPHRTVKITISQNRSVLSISLAHVDYSRGAVGRCLI